MPTRKRHGSLKLTMLTLLTLAAHGNRLAGQSDGGGSDPAGNALDGPWPDVSLNVLVTDRHGLPQKIDERTFQLFEDGSKRPLHFPDSADSPVSLALMVDSSGSIYKQKQAIVSAVIAMMHGLPPDSEVMVVLFAADPYIDLPLTPASKIDFSFLDRLKANGPTALWDTVYATERHLVTHARYPRRAMVILSDGEENASHVKEGNAFWSVEQPGAPVVYSCHVSKANFMQPELMAGHINLRILAKRGGGTVFNLDPDPASAAAQIVADIRSQYVLRFTATDPARNGKAHKLKLQLPTKDVEIYGLSAYHAPEK